MAFDRMGKWLLDHLGERISPTNPLPVDVKSATLPTGAATAAKQPAFGTAGSAATDVVTVQGIASGTAQPASMTDGASVTHGTKADAAYAGSGAASIVALLKGLYNAMVAATPAGANLVGDVGGGTRAGSGGLASISRLLSAAASTNGTSVKASAGRLYKIRGYNAAAAVRYLKLYNKASAPAVGTDTPVATIALKPSDAFDVDFGLLGEYFATGIAFALTTGSADADTGALTAADVVGLNLWYA